MKPSNLAVTYSGGGTMYYHWTTRKDVEKRARELGKTIIKIETF